MPGWGGLFFFFFFFHHGRQLKGTQISDNQKACKVRPQKAREPNRITLRALSLSIIERKGPIITVGKLMYKWR